ncbi:hypothetical protein R1T16_09485 [Flavobacterium sp. DG1-102-2]|uniref:hypothetical protein n=1 Tax=Flavobacterium sp. DG1-102-2 TaxID=3081663 RepID=UPI002948DD88|nr:hypothetical protein [Flavobacterium sp. DG1-102-2]MDV6168655.1 hypothetical protein [Flavobacterium sp. DG1-102-2]
MKNFKHIVSLLALLFSLTVFSQDAKPMVDNEPYEVWYKKLKELYTKRIDSENYKASERASWVYYDMLNMDASDGVEVTKLGPLEWSKANLYKTDFGSFEKAEREFKKLEEASQLDIKGNAEYWNYFTKCLMATDIYDLEIRLEEELREEHPEKFQTRPAKKKKESFLLKFPSLPKP